jgi:hypothetical protein
LPLGDSFLIDFFLAASVPDGLRANTAVKTQNQTNVVKTLWRETKTNLPSNAAPEVLWIPKRGIVKKFYIE